MAFLPNLFGFLMHRGGRDARVPVRAASRLLSAAPNVDSLSFVYLFSFGNSVKMIWLFIHFCACGFVFVCRLLCFCVNEIYCTQCTKCGEYICLFSNVAYYKFRRLKNAKRQL
ncbi:MAG: hypothetical protein LBQ66_03440 [Planctomycetaceae bacterium]|nr:hypothetical protein [Planctomycetaceae bacterium]